MEAGLANLLFSRLEGDPALPIDCIFSPPGTLLSAAGCLVDEKLNRVVQLIIIYTMDFFSPYQYFIR